MPDTTLLTPAELAAHLRTSERTVARMVVDGCPSILVGSRRRFELAAVMAWTTERAVRPAQAAKSSRVTIKQSTAADEYIAASLAAHQRAEQRRLKRQAAKTT